MVRRQMPSHDQTHNAASSWHLSGFAAKKREMDDNSKKIGQLLWRLNAGEVSAGVVPKLMQLCQAIDSADWHTANHIQVGEVPSLREEECIPSASDCVNLCEARYTRRFSQSGASGLHELHAILEGGRV